MTTTIATRTMPFVSTYSAGLAVIAGLSISGQGLPTVSQQAIHISGGQECHLFLSGEKVFALPSQTMDDIKFFSEFSIGLTKTSTDIPGFVFDTLDENIDTLLA